MAALRAVHQIVDAPKIFDDPLALQILGPRTEAALRADPGKFAAELMRYLRAALVVRSRYAEDQLGLAVARGIAQYVVLGAGLDTFAYRNPWGGNRLHVFEVDHPATQTWKKSLLRDAGIPVPPSVTFAAVDFQSETIAQGLDRAGFRWDQPAFFAWLGVTYYLTRDVVDGVLRFIATSTGKGSAVVFDYAISPSSASPRRRAAFAALAQRVALVGEPWRTFFDPPRLSADLRAMGFVDVEDLGPDELNGRYFADRPDGLRLGGLSRLVCARA